MTENLPREESGNSPESPHKRMRKQCVPGASLFFTRAGDEATGLTADKITTHLVLIEHLKTHLSPACSMRSKCNTKTVRNGHFTVG